MTEQVIAQESGGDVADCHLVIVGNVSTGNKVGGVLCDEDCDDYPNWILGCVTDKEGKDRESTNK